MIALVITLFALTDRFCGGGLCWRASFRGRPNYYALPALAGLLWLAGLPSLALAGFVGLAAWRTLGWGWFGGSMTPGNLRETAGTFCRHLLILPGFLFLAPPLDALAMAIAFACVATGLALWLATAGDEAAENDRNTWVELLRGAFLGLTMVVL